MKVEMPILPISQFDVKDFHQFVDRDGAHARAIEMGSLSGEGEAHSIHAPPGFHLDVLVGGARTPRFDDRLMVHRSHG